MSFARVTAVLVALTTASSMGAQAVPLRATSDVVIRMVLDYNDALDRCTRSGCANIDEVMGFYAPDAARYFPGQEPQIGVAAIRAGYVGRAARLEQAVDVKSVERWGDMVVCKIERRDTTMRQAGVEHHVRVFLVKNGKIKQLVVLVDPDEDAKLRAGSP